MGVGAGLYMCDVVVKSSRSLSHLLMSSCLLQRKATRLILGYKKTALWRKVIGWVRVWQHLNKLKQRRLRSDLIENYKIVTGKEKISSSQFFTPYASNYNTRGHCHKHKLTTTRCHLDLRKNVLQPESCTPLERATRQCGQGKYREYIVAGSNPTQGNAA